MDLHDSLFPVSALERTALTSLTGTRDLPNHLALRNHTGALRSGLLGAAEGLSSVATD